MKVWLKALLLSCSILTSQGLWANTEITLNGQLIQGSLIRGKVPSGSTVLFNEQELSINARGQFVFGIGRDASLRHQLTVIKPDGSQQVVPLQFEARQYDIQHITGVAQKYVTPPAEVTERIQNDTRKVRAVRNTLSDKTAIFAEPYLPAKGRISGVYGSQRVFNGEPRNPHYGLDIAAPIGAPVLAPWDGQVLLAEDLYYSGFTLIIDHGMGVSSTLMHLHAIDVVVGQHVRQGQKVAEVGASGRVTGPHLDWRINWLQERLDPQLLLVE
ncbi:MULTISPECIES: M23 family metallopeptidase [unclassified Arsukibacterium]|uniref:M23 family metallopeptidase n=1 Tax=unclassified Arsukibacterium TaxID=2635278 RepID=UPI000C6C2E1F|nr:MULTISPECIES: M23 family metallopeptidase [unclassified Arsukibacterium]MAA93897.1 peptidase [Rheinheimera sp.]MBM33348.1 peptidase [Rheinheimera sp.]HAW91327.1 peptidase [Candidatus Azambacteria bacterium]|tara:strand:- start:2806 stop:3618 length:813 start_codon:yes stop_codon:yes gene_type:complete